MSTNITLPNSYSVQPLNTTTSQFPFGTQPPKYVVVEENIFLQICLENNFLKQQNAALQNQLSAMSGQMMSQGVAVQKLSDENSTMKDDLKTLRKENEELKKENSELRKKIATLEQDLNQVKDELKEIKSDMNWRQAIRKIEKAVMLAIGANDQWETLGDLALDLRLNEQAALDFLKQNAHPIATKPLLQSISTVMVNLKDDGNQFAHPGSLDWPTVWKILEDKGQNRNQSSVSWQPFIDFIRKCDVITMNDNN